MRDTNPWLLVPRPTTTACLHLNSGTFLPKIRSLPATKRKVTCKATSYWFVNLLFHGDTIRPIWLSASTSTIFPSEHGNEKSYTCPWAAQKTWEAVGSQLAASAEYIASAFFKGVWSQSTGWILALAPIASGAFSPNGWVLRLTDFFDCSTIRSTHFMLRYIARRSQMHSGWSR